MSKLRIAVCAFVAVGALCGFTASSAMAGIEWLLGGNPIPAAENAKAEGALTLNFLETETNISLARITCEVVFTGTVGPGAKDEIVKLLNTKTEEISETPLMGLSLDCEGKGGLCAATTLAELWPLRLPWKTELELMLAAPEFLDKVFLEAGKEPGAEIVCLNALDVVTAENVCEGNTSGEVRNTTENDVLIIFSGAAGTEKLKCASPMTEALLEGELLVFVTGKVLAVSDD